MDEPAAHTKRQTLEHRSHLLGRPHPSSRRAGLSALRPRSAEAEGGKSGSTSPGPISRRRQPPTVVRVLLVPEGLQGFFLESARSKKKKQQQLKISHR